MALADEIASLRDGTLADLVAAYDYFTDTKFAWDIVARSISEGRTFSNRSVTTGTLTTHVELIDKSRGYVATQLTEATFQQFIAIFENFFFDLLRLWLTAHPRNLSEKKVDFEDVLNAPDKDAITAQVVAKEINEILYNRPSGWFDYVEEMQQSQRVNNEARCGITCTA